MNAAAPTRGRIGPNAITRLAEALRLDVGEEATNSLFGAAGLRGYLAHPPEHMVDEQEVARLHRALRESYAGDDARRLSRIAGTRTGDYLLAHRIPKPVQALLKCVPASLACRVLLSAIMKHAWTFAGSGTFSAQHGNPTILTIHDNPMCRGVQHRDPQCDYYAATFERLFRVLVSPRARVTETQCEACGAVACTFELDW